MADPARAAQSEGAYHTLLLLRKYLTQPIADRKATPAKAHEVRDDSALIEPLALTAKCLVAQLRQFNETINEFDRKRGSFQISS